ncbi:MAG: DinB family protein [Candidatus Krumholzibacteria bacterium]|nr:DinB family protein [Candidatus Krumholzibacteria bacterium]MDH4338357.1 DinB family protein [Candidatus Krumholzibacteria bacterium]MDH5269807.1 DinB family protein [Candidatus Krumholzibacteria bacterium]
MNPIDAFVAELKIEARSTRKMLERVPPESLGWRPHEKSSTLGKVAGHIADIPGLFIVPLLQDECDYNTYQSNTGTVPEILDTFDANIARSYETLGALTPEQLLAPFRYRYGDRVIFELPRFVVIRSTTFNHLIHHRGQLSVYLRMLGVALPAIYGPTADER